VQAKRDSDYAAMLQEHRTIAASHRELGAKHDALVYSHILLEHASDRPKEAKEQRNSAVAGLERSHTRIGAEHHALIESSEKLPDTALEQKAEIDEMSPHQARVLARS